jgi:hypothetical protein
MVLISSTITQRLNPERAQSTSSPQRGAQIASTNVVWIIFSVWCRLYKTDNNNGVNNDYDKVYVDNNDDNGENDDFDDDVGKANNNKDNVPMICIKIKTLIMVNESQDLGWFYLRHYSFESLDFMFLVFFFFVDFLFFFLVTENRHYNSLFYVAKHSLAGRSYYSEN